jgi:hypothetical protein
MHPLATCRTTWIVPLLLFAPHFLADEAAAAQRTWIGGNVDWVDNGSTANWNPADEPDSDDEAIFNTANLVHLGSDNTIMALTMSGGIDLLTNGHQLNVLGPITISNAGTTLLVQPFAGGVAVNADDVDINLAGAVSMSGGTLDVDVRLDINNGGTLGGFGTIVAGDFDLAAEVALQNSGIIQVGNATNAVLTLRTNLADTIDLDGTAENGLVDVSNASANVGLDTLTLVVDGPLSDAFSGTLQIGQRDTVTFNDNFALSSADLQFDGGPATATMNGPAAVTSIASTVLSVTGAAVINNDMTFTGTANTITVNADSSLTLGGTVTIPDASALNLASLTAAWTITGNTTINEAAGNFNWDGTGSATTTVSGTGMLSITANFVDSTNDVYGGTLNLNDSGSLFVNNAANVWTMAGTLNKNNAGTSNVTGNRINVEGNINVGSGTLDLPQVTLAPGADVVVNGRLRLGGGSDLAGPNPITGTGILEMEGNSTVSANTTIATSTFDWDSASAGGVHTIQDSVVFTINSSTFDSDGDMDDPINLGGNGTQLLVNGPTQWTAVAAINANNAGAGAATIGGTSRLVLSGAAADLNVNGNTTITAPLTLGASSFADIDAGFTLDATGAVTYSGGTIDGDGTYSPGTTNTVTSDSTINCGILDLDGGSWTVESGAELTFNVTDYDTSATNAFDATITLNNGGIFANSPDPQIVMDGILNMNATGGGGAEWRGDAIQIGNDSGTLDSDVNVTGDGNSNSQGRFFSPVTFKSDAKVNVLAGGSLVFNSTATFDTVNTLNNAEFTGAGTMSFGDVVNVNEAVNLNMMGGTVDLDGNDAVGDFVNVDAPLTIHAAALNSFGRVNAGGGVNTLDVNNSVGTGVLTVNLDSPVAEWTLNAPGVMNLVNDNTAATLLAGNGVNVNGTLNVTGDVRTTARLDIGSTGVVNINTPNEPLRLGGGTNFVDFPAEPNTIAGGTIAGPGVLGADNDKALVGFGTINSTVDFDGLASLLADNGTLNLNGAIIDAHFVGTADEDGVLNIPAAWNNSVTNAIQLAGGTVQGGTITNTTPQGILGKGLVTARIINNTQIIGVYLGQPTTLIVETAGNDNDWDGAGAGQLKAELGGTLELRDNATFPFTGTVEASDGGRVFTNGFALDFSPGSTLTLGSGTYESTHSTDIAGSVNVEPGNNAILKVQVNHFLEFKPTSVTTLNANLRLINNNIIIEAGATFGGTGTLIIPNGSAVVADANANINVLLQNDGQFRPAGFNTVGRVDVRDYQQGGSGVFVAEIAGTALNQIDRLVVGGTALLNGTLDIDLEGAFVPALGNNLLPILGATAGVVGQFSHVLQPVGMPVGLWYEPIYSPTSVQLKVVASGDFNLDGTFACADVDALTTQIAGGLHPILFDLNGDALVNTADLTVWLMRAGAANLSSGNPYLPGDANLDGVVDGSDFGIWNSHKFTNATAWCSGNFNADGGIDGSDFGIWNSHKFTSSDASGRNSIIPEPCGEILLLVSASILAFCRNRRC